MKYLLIISLFAGFSCCSTKGSKDTPAAAVTDSSAVPQVSTVNPVPANPAKPEVTEAVTQTPTLIAGNQVALRFGSIASGPIGDEFLKTWLMRFKRDENVELTADKYSGCGKEGEFFIVINKAGFGAEKDNKFNKGLEQLVADEVRRAKAENPSSGSVEIRQNPSPDEYSYCRLGSKKWL